MAKDVVRFESPRRFSTKSKASMFPTVNLTGARKADLSKKLAARKPWLDGYQFAHQKLAAEYIPPELLAALDRAARVDNPQATEQQIRQVVRQWTREAAASGDLVSGLHRRVQDVARHHLAYNPGTPAYDQYFDNRETPSSDFAQAGKAVVNETATNLGGAAVGVLGNNLGGKLGALLRIAGGAIRYTPETAQLHAVINAATTGNPTSPLMPDLPETWLHGTRDTDTPGGSMNSQLTRRAMDARKAEANAAFERQRQERIVEQGGSLTPQDQQRLQQLDQAVQAAYTAIDAPIKQVENKPESIGQRLRNELPSHLVDMSMHATEPYATAIMTPGLRNTAGAIAGRAAPFAALSLLPTAYEAVELASANNEISKIEEQAQSEQDPARKEQMLQQAAALRENVRSQAVDLAGAGAESGIAAGATGVVPTFTNAAGRLALRGAATPLVAAGTGMNIGRQASNLIRYFGDSDSYDTEMNDARQRWLADRAVGNRSFLGDILRGVVDTAATSLGASSGEDVQSAGFALGTIGNPEVLRDARRYAVQGKTTQQVYDSTLQQMRQMFPDLDPVTAQALAARAAEYQGRMQGFSRYAQRGDDRREYTDPQVTIANRRISDFDRRLEDLATQYNEKSILGLAPLARVFGPEVAEHLLFRADPHSDGVAFTQEAMSLVDQDTGRFRPVTVAGHSIIDERALPQGADVTAATAYNRPASEQATPEAVLAYRKQREEQREAEYTQQAAAARRQSAADRAAREAQLKARLQGNDAIVARERAAGLRGFTPADEDLAAARHAFTAAQTGPAFGERTESAPGEYDPRFAYAASTRALPAAPATQQQIAATNGGQFRAPTLPRARPTPATAVAGTSSPSTQTKT